MFETNYPISPANLPKNLTSLTFYYKLRATLAIFAIIAFFLLYFALIISLGYLVYNAFIYEIGNVNKLTIIMKIGAIAGSIMLFIFTLKFIFKLKSHKPNNRIKLSKKGYPLIWSFTEKICKETGAPKPKNIYADPDVNAYVSYTNMWLSLFLPIKKELTIGLGLVSCLNLSEFKAVISHEFGHFAQSSMKIGSYIISANTIIHDMIFSRDKWDDLLDQWRGSDIRLSAAAWVITPIIWLIRQILSLFYQFLNVMYSSLSREMEFNADKVAISTSGSDSIISALWQLDHGFENWNSTMNHAYLASQKEIFTKNLYLHNDLTIKRESNNIKDLLNNLPKDSRGGKMFFTNSEYSKVNMYASHPPNSKRQDNAKTPYIACDIDNRSPWILFDNKEKIQQEMTNIIYDVYLNKKNLNYSEFNVFEQFIEIENKGKELLEVYDNTFENRFLQIPEYEELKQKSILVDSSKIKLDQIKSQLKDLMKPIKDIESLMVSASNISEGIAKEVSFKFNNKVFNKKNLQEGYTLLLDEREKLFTNSFKDWDASFCAFHLALAKKASKEKEILDLYKQHNELSLVYKAVFSVKNTIYGELNKLQTREDVTQSEVTKFGYRVNNLITGLNENLNQLDKLNFVQLPNIDNTNELKVAITEKGVFEKENGNIFENGGFNKLMNMLENTIINCQRIDQKSIIEILSFHHNLHDLID